MPPEMVSDRDLSQLSLSEYQQAISAETNLDQLLSEMRRWLSITVDSIRRLCVLIRRADELKFDWSKFKMPNLDYFRRMADGLLLPELFVGLAGYPQVLKIASRLPIKDQQHIADGQAVKLMLTGGDHLMVKPCDMTADQRTQVFAPNSIRTESQQIAWLTQRQQSRQCQSAPKPDVLLDRRRHGIVVGEVFIGADALAGYLADLAKR